MGKGDKRTKKGKVKAASHGNSRSHKKRVGAKREKVKLIFSKEEPATTTVKATKVKAVEDAVDTEESVA